MRFANKVGIVTGSGGGIGQAYAEALGRIVRPAGVGATVQKGQRGSHADAALVHFRQGLVGPAIDIAVVRHRSGQQSLDGTAMDPHPARPGVGLRVWSSDHSPHSRNHQTEWARKAVVHPMCP